MKMAGVLILLVAVAACDDQSTSDTKTVPSKSEIKEEVKDAVKDELSGKKEPKWKFTYTGDLNGEVSGTIATAVPGPFSVAVAGNSMNKEKTGTAPQKLQGSIFTNKGEKPSAMITLNLMDGTKCKTKPTQDSPMLETKIVDPEKKTFHATFKGEMDCDGKKIQVDGYLKKKR